jgi:hypothetical protein
MRDLPDLGRFALVTVPFRALLHLRDDHELLSVLTPRASVCCRAAGWRSTFHPDRTTSRRGRWLGANPASTSGRCGTRSSAA